MLTHIDKEIFMNAYQVFNEDVINNSRDFIDFLRSESDVRVYGKPDLDLNNLLSGFLQDRGSTKIASRPGKFTKQQINENNPYQLVFIDVEDEIQREQFENEIKCLIGFKDNYETVFEEFKSEPKFRVKKKRNINRNISLQLFESWEQILPDLPVTEIIIIDPFIIRGDDTHPLDKNLFGLLSAIKSKYKILNSLLIFTNNFGKEKLTESEIDEIREEAKQILGIKIFELIEFTPYHDRHIFTNYKHINLGSSVNSFFNAEGNLSVGKSSDIRMFSYSKKDHQQGASDILYDLNRALKIEQLKGKIDDSIKSRLLDYKDGSRE